MAATALTASRRSGILALFAVAFAILPMLLHASTATTGLFLSAVGGSSLVGALVSWALALVVVRWIGFGRETDEWRIAATP